MNASSPEFNQEGKFGLKYLPPQVYSNPTPPPTSGYYPSHQYIQFGDKAVNQGDHVPLDLEDVVSPRTGGRSPKQGLGFSTPSAEPVLHERIKFAKIAYNKYGGKHGPSSPSPPEPPLNNELPSHPYTPYPAQFSSVFGNKIHPGRSNNSHFFN